MNSDVFCVCYICGKMIKVNFVDGIPYLEKHSARVPRYMAKINTGDKALTVNGVRFHEINCSMSEQPVEME